MQSVEAHKCKESQHKLAWAGLLILAGGNFGSLSYCFPSVNGTG